MMHPAALALCATAILQVGYLCWKVSADRRQARSGDLRSLLREKLWWAGAAATVVGWVLFVTATWVGDISIVQPLMSTGDLLLVLAAVVWLRERLTPGEWCGIALVISGAAVLAREPGSTAVGIGWVALTLVLLAAAALGWVAPLLRTLRADGVAAVRVGLAFGCGALLTKALATATWAWDTNGILLRAGILLGVFLANAIGLVLLQVAFACGRASLVVPVQLALANLVVAAGASAIFGERMGVVRIVATAAILTGTALCIGRRGPHPVASTPVGTTGCRTG